jgi:hypothetical protein
MDKQYYKELPHVSKEPVSVVRVHPDKLAINGVHYDGDYFRTFANPETDVLYAVRRDEDGCVHLVVIRTVEEAQLFFDEQGDPLPALPQIGERDLGEEEQIGDDDAL